MKARNMVLVALFAALACAGAVLLRLGGEAVVPFSIMPLVTMLSGALLGSKKGSLSMFVYLLIGLIGIPVFAKPPYGGLTYIFSPSFGFLIGFILGAFVVGKILELTKKRSAVAYFLATLGGLTAIYACGLPYLYLILNFYLGKSFSVVQTLKIGLLPFILFDLVKAAIVVVIAKPVADRLEFLR
ncbi:MAG: biotin transporter BioY [Candidatus Subteraquimicrobiales bacterium]|nr:biotin transporter BioY [Candidatus Subteraquimicrobiales bacterium]